MAVNINIPSQVTQEITEGVTSTAPSEDAVFNALADKANSADLALVATSGDYNDLDNLPLIPSAQVNSDWNATSGVEEILNKPSIPAAQIQSDWNQATNTALDYIKNKPSIPSIAGLVPNTRNLTINGTTYDLSADRTWTIAATASLLQHEVKAGEILTKGQAVYVSSADGTNMIVTKASNATEATSSKTMGLIAQNLANNGKGYVITEGLLSGLNTGTATDGDPVWLGTGGNLIYGLLNKPAAPAHLVFIGIVTRANVSNGEIFVRVQNGFELQELHNVSITSVADNNLLQYDAATSLWKNESLATAGIQSTLESGTSIKTINGTSVLGSGDIAISSGLTVGTTAVTSGTIGRVFFQGTGDVVQQDSALFYDNTNKRLGLGANGNTPTSTLFVRTNTNTAHDTFILQNGQYGNPILRVRDNATASQSTIGSLFVAARIYGSNSTVTGNELDLGGYGLGASYGNAATNAVWLNNQGNNGDGAGTSVISVTSNVFINNQTTKKYKFETVSGHFGIGQVGTLGARLDVKAQGALSTDIAFRVRNSADTSNLMSIGGDGQIVIGLGASINLTANSVPQDSTVVGRGATAGLYGTAIGAQSNSENYLSVSVGRASRAGISSVAVGAGATAYNSAQYATLAIGTGTNASGINSGVISIGDQGANAIPSSMAFTINNTGSNQSLFFTRNTNIVMKTNSALISGTHWNAAATNTITIHNGTIPDTTIANAGQLYVEGGALKFRGGSGTITVVAPA